MDVIVILIALVCIAFHIYRTITIENKLNTLLDNPNRYLDFQFLSYWQTQFNNIMAIAVFFAWVKVSCCTQLFQSV